MPRIICSLAKTRNAKILMGLGADGLGIPFYSGLFQPLIRPWGNSYDIHAGDRQMVKEGMVNPVFDGLYEMKGMVSAYGPAEYPFIMVDGNIYSPGNLVVSSWGPTFDIEIFKTGNGPGNRLHFLSKFSRPVCRAIMAGKIDPNEKFTLDGPGMDIGYMIREIHRDIRNKTKPIGSLPEIGIVSIGYREMSDSAFPMNTIARMDLNPLYSIQNRRFKWNSRPFDWHCVMPGHWHPVFGDNARDRHRRAVDRRAANEKQKYPWYRAYWDYQEKII